VGASKGSPHILLEMNTDVRDIEGAPLVDKQAPTRALRETSFTH
jgi:hypothetical protein